MLNMWISRKQGFLGPYKVLNNVFLIKSLIMCSIQIQWVLNIFGQITAKIYNRFKMLRIKWIGISITYYSILFYENEIKKFSHWKRSDLWLKEQARLYLQLSWIKSRMNWWNIKTINTIYEWCSANWHINYYSTETIKYIFYLILCRTFK